MITGEARLRLRDLIPTALVVVLAIGGPLLSHRRDDPCHTSDGPQFACWLAEHPS